MSDRMFLCILRAIGNEATVNRVRRMALSQGIDRKTFAKAEEQARSIVRARDASRATTLYPRFHDYSKVGL